MTWATVHICTQTGDPCPDERRQYRCGVCEIFKTWLKQHPMPKQGFGDELK